MYLDLVGIFGAGLLTLVTPCVLPLIPVYFAMLLGSAAETPGRPRRFSLFLSTLFFSLGMLIIFVVLGLTATSLGALIGSHRTELVTVGGLVIFLFGLKLLGVLRIPWLDRERRALPLMRMRVPWLNALALGIVFSLGWTPCVGPILGSVLTYTASSASSPLLGALYLAVYGAGFIVPMLVLSLFADRARQLLTRIGPWLPRIEKIGGVALAGVGLYLLLGVGQAPPATMTTGLRQQPAAVRVSVQPPIGQPSPRPRMVEFSTPDCSICRQMIPTVALIENECGGKQVEVVKVDLRRSENRSIAAAYGIRGVPTFVFLDRKGEAVARLVGQQTLGALRQALATLVGAECDGVGLLRPEPEPPRVPTCDSVPNPKLGPTCGG